MPPQPDLDPSDRQLDVLRYIILHVEDFGYQPSQSEIASHFGVTKNAIQNRLKELVRRNLIEMPVGEKKRERAIVLKHIRFVSYYSEKAIPAPQEETS